MEKLNWLAILLTACIPGIIMLMYQQLSKSNVQPHSKQLIKYLVQFALSILICLFMVGFNNSPGQEGQFDNFGHGVWHGLFVAILLGLPLIIIRPSASKINWKTGLTEFALWALSLGLIGGLMDAFHHWPN